MRFRQCYSRNFCALFSTSSPFIFHLPPSVSGCCPGHAIAGSEKTCAELGWRVNYPKRTTDASATNVCSATSELKGGCPGANTFLRAQKICAANGARSLFVSHISFLIPYFSFLIPHFSFLISRREVMHTRRNFGKCGRVVWVQVRQQEDLDCHALQGQGRLHCGRSPLGISSRGKHWPYTDTIPQ